jgi:hypothetical protein
MLSIASYVPHLLTLRKATRVFGRVNCSRVRLSAFNTWISPKKSNDSDVDEDKLRVENAMKIRTDEIKKSGELSTKNPEQIYGVPSVDFGRDYNLPHPIWNKEFVWRVDNLHRHPSDLVDRLALWTIRAMRFNFDWMSGWMFGKPTVTKALNRVCFLETVAGVPGSVAGIVRHLASLRRLKRDNGWIHTLFEEAENERMHLLTYLELKKPTPLFRFVVWLTQGIFFNFYFVAYLLSPRYCHRLVGYLEEQAVITYTKILNEIDGNGDLKKWKTTPAPDIAKKYWKLDDNATMHDVVAVTRADEAHHRDVNHAFAGMKPTDPNPFNPGM